MLKIFESAIVGVFVTSVGVFAEESNQAVTLVNDYSIVKDMLEKIGIGEQGIWKIADFDGDNVVALNFSVKTEVDRTDPEQRGVDDTVYNFKPMQSLPKEIGQLKSLRKLILDGNILSVLPDEIGNLQNLKYLSVQNNRLETVPLSIGNLKNLSYLNLRGNLIRDFPETTQNLKALEFLDLSNNRLKALGTELGGMYSLKSLFLKENPLSTLPQTVTGLKLKRFDVDYAGLRKMNAELKEWVKANNDEDFE